MQLTSPAFRDGTELPRRFTCDGSELSPPLEWLDVPPQARSLALVLEDPDAPSGLYTHWVVYNLPPHARMLDESVANQDLLPQGAKPGINDSRQPGYDGPCPPRGQHRYVCRLYALDTILPDLGLPSRQELLDAMDGHVLAMAELHATYQRH